MIRTIQGEAATSFFGYDGSDAYEAACRQWAPGQPIPVYTNDRADLVHSMDAATRLYEAVGEPRRRPAATLIVGDERAILTGVDVLLRRLIKSSVSSLADFQALPVGSVSALILVARYDDLRHEFLDQAATLAASRGVKLHLLTGRDDQSLSWMVAKQFLRPVDAVEATGVYSGASNIAAAAGHVTVVGERDIDVPTLPQELQSRSWRQIVFHGHGTEDSINLGDSTICGLNGFVRDISQNSLKPKCGYGLGCYKPESGVVELRTISAASIVLASCCNATIRPASYYDPKYHLLLSGVDGTAQHMLVAPAVHDADAAELLAWIDVYSTGRVLSGAPDLRDIHPFLAFVEIGLPPSDSVESVGATLPESSRLGEVAQKAHWLLAKPIRSENRGVVKSLEQLADKIDIEFGRGMRGNPRRWAQLETSVASDVQSIDLRLAKQISRNPEDPSLDFPQYFGDRSEVDPTSVSNVDCMCGIEAVEWERIPLLPFHPRTKAMVCPRCGDVRFSLPDAPVVEMRVDEEQFVGEAIRARITIAADENTTVHVGVFAPRYLRTAFPTPAPQRVKVVRGLPTTFEISLECREIVTPQAYYVTAFAISNLSLTTVRQRFGMHPRPLEVPVEDVR